MGSSSIAHDDQLSAFRWPREVGYRGWERGSRGRGYGDICMHMADSFCCTIETTTVLWSNHTPVKIYKKKKTNKTDFEKIK